MRFKIDLQLNDGLAEAPSYEISANIVALLDAIEDELVVTDSRDNEIVLPVGGTLTVTRIL